MRLTYFWVQQALEWVLQLINLKSNATQNFWLQFYFVTVSWSASNNSICPIIFYFFYHTLFTDSDVHTLSPWWILRLGRGILANVACDQMVRHQPNPSRRRDNHRCGRPPSVHLRVRPPTRRQRHIPTLLAAKWRRGSHVPVRPFAAERTPLHLRQDGLRSARHRHKQRGQNISHYAGRCGSKLPGFGIIRVATAWHKVRWWW